MEIVLKIDYKPIPPLWNQPQQSAFQTPRHNQSTTAPLANSRPFILCGTRSPQSHLD